jgi:hypothetical protein
LFDQPRHITGGWKGEVREERRLFHRKPTNMTSVSLFR